MKTIYRCLIGLALAFCANGAAFGQYMPTEAMNIPLSYVPMSPGSNEYRLGINVGINGGQLQSYVFDTGSAPFNAAYNPATWNGFGGGSTTSAPASTIPNGNNIEYCYGASSNPCRGFVGNIVQVPSLTFQNTIGGTTTLNTPAGGGFQIIALSSDSNNSQPGNPIWSYPDYFCGAPYSCPANPNPAPPDLPSFYGIFGAGNFVSIQTGCSTTITVATTCPTGNVTAPVVMGSPLGQISVANSNMAQGYVVAANGQANPANTSQNANMPLGTAQVKLNGTTVALTACNPCLTVGLTPQVIGQFAVGGAPSQTAGLPGLVNWAQTASHTFPNPYGSGPGNNSSREYGVQFSVSLSPPGTSQGSVTTGTLLDTGTLNFTLSSLLSGAGPTPGTMTMTGLNPDGSAIPGLQGTSANLNPNSNSSYFVGFYNSSNQHILGLPFFMQNSVMFDLSDKAIGYTRFFVTDTPFAIASGSSLTVTSASVPLGLAGAISGAGDVTIQNGATVQTSATNSYTGKTRIRLDGTLLVAGPGSIQSSSGVRNHGHFDISQAWAPIVIETLTGRATGTVALGGNNLTIANGTGTYSGKIIDGGSYPVTGGSLTLAAGRLTLAGANTYTGGTFVEGGTLRLTGTMLGSLWIRSGATFTTGDGYSVAPGDILANAGRFKRLPGSSTLLNQGLLLNNGTLTGGLTNTGTVINNGLLSGVLNNSGSIGGTGTINGTFTNTGLVSPGNSIGTLAVNGSYTQAAGSSYAVETNAQGQSDLIAVSGAPGTAIIAAGSSVFVTPAATGPYAPRTSYTILSATGGVTGTYSSATSLAATSLPFLLPSLSYDANNVYLTLQVGGFARQAQTPNQDAVGAVLDTSAIGATGDWATVLGAFSTMNAQQGVAAMNAISGQNYSAFSSTGIATTQVFMTNFANTVGGTSGGGTSGGSKRIALAEACDVACDTTAPGRWGAWGGALGGFGVVGGTANAGTLTYSLGGFAAGLDRRVTDELLVGVTAGFTSGTQWVGGFSGRGLSDTFQAGLYASYARDAVYVDGLAAYAYSDNRMQRQITMPGLSRIANGRTGANLFFGQVETGYRFEIGGLAEAYVTPFARLQGATATQNAFTESGAGSLDLSVAAQTTNSLRSVLGAQLGGSMDLGWREKLAMQVKLGWGHEYADTGRPVTASFVGAPALPFTTYGAAPQRDSVVLGLSATTAIADAASVYFRYEGTVSSQDSNHALTAGFRMTW